MKKDLFACGNGVATSTMVRSKVEDYLADKGISIKAHQCKVQEVSAIADEYDLVVTSGKFKTSEINTPCIMAINLLTGINEDATLEAIYNAVKE